MSVHSTDPLQTAAWLNPPAQSSREIDGLRLVTDDRTDFWRETAYGFVRDSGHFLGLQTGASFTFQLRVRARFEALYDQAGLMVRLDAERWVKAGVEFSDGRPMASSVLTIGRSDWATAPFDHHADDFWMRATVADGVLRLQISGDGQTWPLMRLAPFPRADIYHVGPMACSPERAGLEVRFSDLRLSPALGKGLHDLS